MSYLHVVTIAICLICILSHMYFVAIALFLIYILLQLHYVGLAFCLVCILSFFWHFVTFASCQICILSWIHFSFRVEYLYLWPKAQCNLSMLKKSIIYFSLKELILSISVFLCIFWNFFNKSRKTWKKYFRGGGQKVYIFLKTLMTNPWNSFIPR